MQNSRCAVILAASDGKQMKSSRPAAMAEVLFQPMIDWVLDAVQNAGINQPAPLPRTAKPWPAIWRGAAKPFCWGLPAQAMRSRRHAPFWSVFAVGTYFFSTETSP